MVGWGGLPSLERSLEDTRDDEPHFVVNGGVDAPGGVATKDADRGVSEMRRSSRTDDKDLCGPCETGVPET